MKSNIEIAKNAANVICDYLEGCEIGKFQAHPKTRQLVSERILCAINEADRKWRDRFRKFKKIEKKFGPIDAITADLLKAVTYDNNHPQIDQDEPKDDPDCFCVRCCAIRLLSVQGSEVPTQKAPTDSSRKQEPDAAALREALQTYALVIHRNVEHGDYYRCKICHAEWYCNELPTHKDDCLLSEGLAARVEPTKEEKHS